MPTRFDADLDALSALLHGQPAYRIRQVWDGLYHRFAAPEEMTDLPKALRAEVEAALPPALELRAEQTADRGQTVKFLWALSGGATVETVLMHYRGRSTVCVSSQAGCAMGCSFCATGQAGFSRHLSTGEIVEQVVRAARHAVGQRAGAWSAVEGPERKGALNVVFMGMGEPMANYDATWAAVERLHGAVGISARHLTISTVGIIPGIRRLAAEALPVNLAVSLHAANDGLRNELVPINRKYPLGPLAAACRDYVATSGRRLSLEWALIDGVNDRTTDAMELAEFARPLRAHVNLIPLNPTPGYAVRGTAPGRVRAFATRLGDLGVNATVRQTRGTDIDAACGQLAAVAGARPAAPVATPARRRTEAGTHGAAASRT